MIHRRKLSAALVCVALVAAACGDDDDDTGGEATAEAIDAEVSSLVLQAHSRTKHLLSERRRGLAELARTLEAEETLEGDKLTRALESAKIADAQRPAEPPTDRKTMVA